MITDRKMLVLAMQHFDSAISTTQLHIWAIGLYQVVAVLVYAHKFSLISEPFGSI